MERIVVDNGVIIKGGWTMTLTIELPPETDEWLAIRDRLLRASSH